MEISIGPFSRLMQGSHTIISLNTGVTYEDFSWSILSLNAGVTHGHFSKTIHQLWSVCGNETQLQVGEIKKYKT